jgi:hypothetical protein
VQYFFWLLSQENLLSDTDAAYVAISVACVWKSKRIAVACEWYKGRPQWTHENHMMDLLFSEPNEYKILLRFDGLSYDGLLKILPLQVLQK